MSSPSVLTPIADLSYRNYDGPLSPPAFRWWVIAKRLILNAIRLRSLWVVTVLSGWYYLIMIVILFFMQQLAGANKQNQDALSSLLGRIVWKDQFLHGFSFSQAMLLVIALMVGAGAIANDNRANALLVYLSKPCTKLDYVLGKWVGIFIVILGVEAIPTIAFYVYGLLSFRDQGFFRDDHFLLFRILCVLPLSAALHTSLVLAVSSMFRQGRIAGASYAGLYFLTNFFTVLMKNIWGLSGGTASGLIKTLDYCSIDGIQIGLAKAILQPYGSQPFGLNGKDPFWIPAPPLVPFLLFVIAVMAVSLFFVWSRVRAVEVV